jgi:tetratricopeptide (TPR) repeat protein
MSRRLITSVNLLLLLQLLWVCQAQANGSLTEIGEKVQPAVVNIFWGMDAIGCGFFINRQGHVITSRHILAETGWPDIQASEALINVRTKDGKHYGLKKILADFKDMDLLVFSIYMPQYTPDFIQLTKTTTKLNEPIIVVGGNSGPQNLSNGIISGFGRLLEMESTPQITASILPTFQGGPVVNSRGELVGVARSQQTENQKLIYATPVHKIVDLKSRAAGTPAVPSGQAPSEKKTEPLQGERQNQARMCSSQGLKFIEAGQYEKGVEAIRQAIQSQPDDASLHYNLGAAYVKLAKYQGAAEALKKAVTLKPGWAEAHHDLGKAYLALGRNQEALGALNEALRLKKFAEAYLDLGLANLKLGHHEEAVEALKQAVRLKPDEALIYYKLGVAYAQLGRHDKVIEATKQAIKLKPDLPGAYHNLGEAYARLNHWQEAVKALEQALQIKPDPRTFTTLGMVYGKLGIVQKEVEAYKQAIRLNPEFAMAHHNLGYSYLIHGASSEALAEYKILQGQDQKLAETLFNAIYY